MTNLIDRLRELDGPCRETDALIVKALYPSAQIGPWPTDDFDDVVFHASPLIQDKQKLPKFTESIDAALQLVPDGCLTWHDQPETDLFTFGLVSELYDAEEKGRTLPIAICIASLSALEKGGE